MTQQGFTPVGPAGVKHNFDPGATVPSGMPTRCRGNWITWKNWMQVLW
jgi:hypothetical protein